MGDVVLSKPQQAQRSTLAVGRGRDDGERRSKCLGSIVLDFAFLEVQGGETLGQGGGGELGGEGGSADIIKRAALEHEAAEGRDDVNKSSEQSLDQPGRKNR